MPDNIAKLLFKVLTAYNVSVTKQTIEHTIPTHPGYPSMQCISDALDSWKIKHVAVKLSLEKHERTFIYCNGDVSFCCHDWRNEYVMGYLHENSLVDIINGEKYNRIREMVDRMKQTNAKNDDSFGGSPDSIPMLETKELHIS